MKIEEKEKNPSEEKEKIKARIQGGNEDLTRAKGDWGKGDMFVLPNNL